jgi:hypothetical protein
MDKPEEIRKAVATVAETEAGKVLLRYLHDICGFDQADRFRRADGAVDPIGTTINVERRGVYVEIRKFVPIEVLKQTEYPEIKEENK